MNSGDARTGSIQIIAAGGGVVATLSISQDGVCRLQINPAGQSVNIQVRGSDGRLSPEFRFARP